MRNFFFRFCILDDVNISKNAKNFFFRFSHLRRCKHELTHAGIYFFAPLRGYRPKKWSPGESALLGDWLFIDLVIWVQQNEKRLNSSVDMSKCPKNVLFFLKMSIKKTAVNHGFRGLIFDANLRFALLASLRSAHFAPGKFCFFRLILN